MSANQEQKDNIRILAISKTIGFRHDSIPNAIKAFVEIGQEKGWSITFTEDTSFVHAPILKDIDVVVFLLSTGDILNENEQKDFKAFIQNGGGFFGLHSGGTDTEYKWEWYSKLIGAHFKGHPPVCEHLLNIEDREHPATKHFQSDKVKWTDEIYSFDRNPRDKENNILISVDEDSYDTNNNPWFKGVELAMGDHPLAWYKHYDGGRVISTALGHTIEIYDDPLFREHIVGCIRWAAGVEK